MLLCRDGGQAEKWGCSLRRDGGQAVERGCSCVGMEGRQRSGDAPA